VVGIAAVVLVGFALSPYFLTGNNLRNIVITGAVVSVLAVGQFMVIVTAGIDLSVGAVTALSTVLAAVAMRSGWSPIAAVLLAFICCTLVGVANGLLVVHARITPFIATLGMLGVAQGLAYLVQNGTLVVITHTGFVSFFAGDVLGLPAPVIIFVLVTLIFAVIMRWTAFGRQLYAIGGNAEAARLSGLPVTRNIIAAYSISGALAGLAGLMLAAQLSSGNSLLGQGLELDAIAAAVVGGASLFGGLGTPVSAVLGGLLIGAISNIMDLRSVPAEPQLIIKGLLILLAVYLTSGGGSGLVQRLVVGTRTGRRQPPDGTDPPPLLPQRERDDARLPAESGATPFRLVDADARDRGAEPLA
jgi:ribose transport system permease protein